MTASENVGEKKRIAIGCQGGGVPSAFAAGALKRILRDEQHEIVALSGTSGGAICAFFAWYALLEQRDKEGAAARAAELLESFWRDNSANDPLARVLNEWTVWLSRLEGRTALLEVSPYSTNLSSLIREQLRKTIQGQQVDFGRLGELVGPASPALLVGAIDVVEGAARNFDSRNGEISVDALLASSSVPPVFQAMHMEGNAYWDALFCQNPPVRELGRMQPDEIWIVRVTPWSRGGEPKSVGDMMDRRNELSGNVALHLEVLSIEQINEFVDGFGEGEDGDKRLRLPDGKEYRHVEVRELEMSPEVYQSLDFATKLDRRPSLIQKLMDHGEQRAAEFLKG